MVREIEVKYRVADLEELLVMLKERGVELGEPVFQDDQAYAPWPAVRGTSSWGSRSCGYAPWTGGTTSR